jgi:hypothetical protein
MAKARHDEPTSSKTTMALLIVGGLLVVALVAWALTRTVEPDSTTATTTFASTSAPVASDSSATPAPTATGQLVTSDTSATSVPNATSPTNLQLPAPAPVPHPEGNRAEVPRIAAEDLRAKVNRSEVTVIDVRQAADYARGHIAGAINIPFASIETQLDQIPKGKEIVTYCT